MKKNTKELFEKRRIRLKQLEKEIEKNVVYCSFAEEEKELFENLKSSLTYELKGILIMYLEIIEKIITFQSEYFYDNGFSDCAEIFREIYEEAVNKS